MPPIEYLEQETTLSEKLQTNIKFPIRLFDLQSLNIDSDIFIKELGESFNNLSWDHYDVRKLQFDRLKETFYNQQEQLEEIFADFFEGQLSVEDIQKRFGKLDQEVLTQLYNLKPFRKRSVCTFLLKKEDDKHNIQRVDSGKFSQSAVHDYRKHSRTFLETSNMVCDHPLFQELLQGLAKIILEVAPKAFNVKIICHQVRVVARHDNAGDNSPEGIHQDGFPYIVSALVVRRENIVGGKSRIYDQDKKTCFLDHMLQPGQGIFQADKDSCLWHQVTKFKINDQTKIGFRDSFGFDVDIG